MSENYGLGLGDTSTGNKPTQLLHGFYVGIVKDNFDPAKMGSLKVLIPSLHGSDEGSSDALIQVGYLSPFYGVKSANAVKETQDIADFSATQHSYGMWMTPPDIDTRVMVIFVEGKPSQGYWIGCVQEPYMNHMMPGIAASKDTIAQQTDGESASKSDIYGTEIVPAGEINRAALSYAKISGEGVDRFRKPIHPFANTLRNQGLIQDTVRGTTSSSARRESPSAVFGISTPGRADPERAKVKLGPVDALKDTPVVRSAGHTFVMDDGDAEGDNQLIRLRTSSGHQLLMHDTAGVIYLANAKGTVWMEFSGDGAVDIYAQKGYNIRSGGDINFHSEGDINMYANRNIKIKANEHLGQDPMDRTIKGIISIDGSIINQLANKSMNLSVNEGYYSLRTAMGIYTQAAGGQQIHQASGQVHLVGSQVHFNSMPADPNLLQPLKRTAFNQPHGTGTGEIQIPDVTPVLRGSVGVLKQDRSIPGMSGMRVPTHEPFLWHYDNIKSFTSAGRREDANTPGTLGYVEQRNRLRGGTSGIAQMEADTEEYIKKLGIPVTDIAALQKTAGEFVQNYPIIFNLPNGGPLASRALLPGISDVSNRVINRITGAAGGELGNLFKDQIFVNQAGVLYSIGDMGKVINNLPGGNVIGNLAATAQNTVNNTVGNIINNSINSVTRSVADSVFSDRNTSAVKDFFRGDGIDTYAIANDMSLSSFVDPQVFGGGLPDLFKNVGDIFGPGAFGNFGISGINLANLSPEGLIQGLGTAAINQGISIVTDQFRNIIAGEITSMTNITSVLSGANEILGSVASSAGDLWSFAQGGFAFSDGADVVTAAFDFGGFSPF